MKTYLILSLSAAAVCAAVALLLAFTGKRSETKVTIAGIVGGLSLFLVALSLCLAFFVV